MTSAPSLASRPARLQIHAGPWSGRRFPLPCRGSPGAVLDLRGSTCTGGARRGRARRHPHARGAHPVALTPADCHKPIIGRRSSILTRLGPMLRHRSMGTSSGLGWFGRLTSPRGPRRCSERAVHYSRETAMARESLRIDNARYVLTLDRERRIIRDGSILVEDGRIRRVGKAAELAGARADRVIDARRLLVTPGFMNGHMHISYAHPVRGIFPDEMASPLNHVFNLQAAMTEEEEYHASLLGIVELLEERDGVLRRSRQHEVPGRVPAGLRGLGHPRHHGRVRDRRPGALESPQARHRRGGPPHRRVHRQVERPARWPAHGVGHAVFAGDLYGRAAERAEEGGRRAADDADPSPQ